MFSRYKWYKYIIRLSDHLYVDYHLTVAVKNQNPRIRIFAVACASSIVCCVVTTVKDLVSCV